MGENDAKGVLGGVVAFFFGGEGRLSLRRCQIKVKIRLKMTPPF